MRQLPGIRSKKTGIAVALVVLLLVCIQFINPPIPNPPVTHPIKAPAEVTAIFRRACYDCHSNETNLTWYDKIAPVSWLVAADIEKARSRFNFSTWDTLSPADQQGRTWEMINMVLDGKMPLSAYLKAHPQARLSEKDIEVLKKYAVAESPAHYNDTTIIREAERESHEYQERTLSLDDASLPDGYVSHAQDDASHTRGYTSRGLTIPHTPVAANGVQYIPDFQNWQVISTTNRFDNHSIRVMYGNDILVKAIREGHTNPLPNGSTIVKVVWNSIEAEKGDIIPGTFGNVQIMTKDYQRFPDSKGWGFARFNGLNLKPYGTTASFNTTCFNCHKAASANDFLFNLPLKKENIFDADSLRVITSFANTRQKTMSVLYGNAAARLSALNEYKKTFAGQQFRLVTWRQEDNKYWFGSHINGSILRVENAASAKPSVFP